MQFESLISKLQFTLSLKDTAGPISGSSQMSAGLHPCPPHSVR